MCGIYKITNVQNGKIYIGSSVEPKSRWNQHLHHLRKNKHHSQHLQRAFLKYEENSFCFEVIEETTQENLIIREQFYLNKFNSCDVKVGYNLCPIAGSSLGIKRSEEFKRKVSESRMGDKNWRKGIKLSEETLEKCKNSKLGSKNPMCGGPILQCDINGNVIKEWECLSEAARILGYCRQNIAAVIKNKGKTAHGFKWKLKSSLYGGCS